MDSRPQEPDRRRPSSLTNFNNNNHNHNHNGTTQTLETNIIHYSPRSPNRVNPTATIISPSSGSNPPKLSPPLVRYRECLKNHAAGLGGSVYDGCGEFMPSGQEGSIEALKCAACDCHRNFHRKEADGERTYQYGVLTSRDGGRRSTTATTMMLNHLQLPPILPHHPHHHQQHHQPKFSPMHASPSSAMAAAPMSMAFGGGNGGGGGTDSSSEDLNVYGQSSADHGGGVVVQQPPSFSLSKKRNRTKFSQEQKDKMLGFAEKLGWRMNKLDEEEVERFCAEVGVKRQVFKVWMHNNKNNAKNGKQFELGGLNIGLPE